MSAIAPQQYRSSESRDDLMDVHRWSRNHRGTPSELIGRAILTPLLATLYRVRHVGKDHVPDGAALLLSNHASHIDHFFVEIWLPRHPKFMAKSQLFTINPVLRAFLKYASVFPVRRGAVDEDAFETARINLERDSLVLSYPEGGRSRTPGRLGEPRWGAGKMALQTDAPVVPVMIHGSDQARFWRRNWPRGRFPPVTVWFGAPLHFEPEPDADRDRCQQVADQIFERVRDMHGRLDRAIQTRGRRAAVAAAERGEI